MKAAELKKMSAEELNAKLKELKASFSTSASSTPSTSLITPTRWWMSRKTLRV